MEKHADVDAYLAATPRWRDETVALRAILLDLGLDEAVKWGKPCYGHDGSNVAIIQPFQGLLALLFFKGALLDDPEGLLQEQGENTRSARRLLFESRQREYNLYISGAKQARTRAARVDKHVPRILAGKGMRDR